MRRRARAIVRSLNYGPVKDIEELTKNAGWIFANSSLLIDGNEDRFDNQPRSQG